jgi:hypothetical protein
MPIIIALFFNEIKSNIARSVYQVLTYLPKFISTVVMTTLVSLLVRQSSSAGAGIEMGIISQLLCNLGIITEEVGNAGLLNNPDFFRPIYKKQESNNKASIVKFIINKRYTDEEINKYPHLKALVKFFENYKDRTIEIKDIAKDEKIYQGKDMRAFNKLIVKDEISDLYKQVFKEMEKGFNCIETTEENKTKVEDIVKFLNMYPFVEVKVKEQKKNKKNK